MSARAINSYSGTARLRSATATSVDIQHDTDDHKVKYKDDGGTTRVIMVEGLAPAAFALELAQDAVVAGTTQTQAGATAITGQVARVGTVATAGDGVRLPTSVAGLIVTLINDGATPMKVYGAGTDTINSIATATGLYQGVGSVAVYTCTVAGNWKVASSQLQGTIPGAAAASAALLPDAPQSYRITKAGVAAMTLAAPAAQSDGQIITIFSETAFAHTLTATGLLLTGGAAVNLATFAAQAGAGLTLMVRGGKFVVIAAEAISFS